MNFARLKPLEGRALFLEQCTRMRLRQLKAQCGVRDYDALSDLCVILEGGGSVTLCASCVRHSIKFNPSFCRGEVCIYALPTHRYFRVNFRVCMFDVVLVCCIEALMTLTCSTKQTFAHEELEQESDCCDCCLTRLYFCQSRMHTHIRSLCSLMYVHMHLLMCCANVVMQAYTHLRGSSR